MKYQQKFSVPMDGLDPRVRKTTALERGDWFAPVGPGPKEEKDPTIQDFGTKTHKTKKVIKTILQVIGIANFLVLGYYFLREFFEPNFYNYKIY